MTVKLDFSEVETFPRFLPNPEHDFEHCDRWAEECLDCGAKDCPHEEPLHYHHDGCPACD